MFLPRIFPARGHHSRCAGNEKTFFRTFAGILTPNMVYDTQDGRVGIFRWFLALKSGNNAFLCHCYLTAGLLAIKTFLFFICEINLNLNARFRKDLARFRNLTSFTIPTLCNNLIYVATFLVYNTQNVKAGTCDLNCPCDKLLFLLSLDTN